MELLDKISELEAYITQSVAIQSRNRNQGKQSEKGK
jgi:hypothetical protein